MSWINTIAQGIENAFKAVRPALQSIPPLLLLCEVFQRPGLSAIALTSAIIRRLPEAGIETGVNADGSPNKINQFVRVLCEEIVTEIKDNAKVTCVLQPGTINSIGTGANAGGPVVVTSYNTIPVNTMGIIQ
jgi:hypothetical protein